MKSFNLELIELLADIAPQFKIHEAVRFVKDENGVILFNTDNMNYFFLDTVGALIWSQIELGVPSRKIILHICTQFKATDKRSVSRDVCNILASLVKNNCITSTGVPVSHGSFASASTSSIDIETDHDSTSAGFFQTMTAIAFLAYFGALMRFSWLPNIYDTVGRISIRKRAARFENTVRTRHSVDQAALVFNKQTWCLQLSATYVCMLRRQGVPAELVIGVRTYPFQAHAWVELDGYILNDRLDYVSQFLVLDRI